MKIALTKQKFISLALIIAFLLLGYGNPLVAAQDSGEDDGLSSPLRLHIVERGQTLDQVAGLYGVEVESINALNGLVGSIYAGQRLIVPADSHFKQNYFGDPLIVDFDDNLFTLAAQRGLSVDSVGQAVSAVNPMGLYSGQSLTLPDGGGGSTALFRFGANDALWKLAVRHDVSLVSLMSANQIVNPTLISQGHLLAIPSSEEIDSGRMVPSPWVGFRLLPAAPEPGKSFTLRVTTEKTGILTGTFNTATLNFVSEDGLSHEMVLGIDRWADPGIYPLTLSFEAEDGSSYSYVRQVLLKRTWSESESIRLSEEVSEVLNDPAIVQGELNYLAQSMGYFHTEKYWSGRFLLPSPGVMTSAFGTLRSYNGGPFDSYHSGSDIAARLGTPIYAPADGVVVDTGELDVRGLITILNHGRGVYTGYWHQSSILVSPGQFVVAGQQIGAIGNTGLSTAAHLHWELRVGGVQVDPLQWVREEFP